MPQGWADLFSRHNLPQLERDVIPAFLPRQRWFGAKDQRLAAVARAGPWRNRRAPARGRRRRPRQLPDAGRRGALAGGERQHYFAAAGRVLVAVGQRAAAARCCRRRLAELRQFRREGALVDAAVAGRVRAGAARRDRAAERRAAAHADGAAAVAFRQTPLFAEAADAGAACRAPARRRAVEQLGAVRGIRGPEALSPAAAGAASRRSRWAGFLVERAGFANTPPLLGTIEMTLPAPRARMPTPMRARRAVRLRAQPGRRLDAGARLSDRAISTTR